MVSFVEYLNIPAKIALIIIGVFFVIQIIGEILEFKGKVVPEIVKVRKYFKRKKLEKQEAAKRLEEMYELNKEVKVLLNDVNAHYSADNIAKRDSWMQWVNDKVVTYDTFIKEMGDKFADVVKVLEEVFVQNNRDRIIDFATKVSDEKSMVSREEFNRIFKVHKKYEDFLEERNLTNGEVDIAYRIIADSYEGHMRNHTFVEDVRGYNE
jgi:GTP-sensing pleiotropic transcriptional regulator CodY